MGTNYGTLNIGDKVIVIKMQNVFQRKQVGESMEKLLVLNQTIVLLNLMASKLLGYIVYHDLAKDTGNN